MPPCSAVGRLKDFHPPVPSTTLEARLTRAERKVAREHAARLEAEAIAEKGLRELYETQQRLLLLQRVTDGANRTSDVATAFRLALAEVCGQMGWAFGNTYLCEGRAAVGCDIWFAEPGGHLFEFVEVSRSARFAINEGLPGRVMQDNRPHWIEDVTRDSNFPRAEIAARCGLGAACAFPVLAGNDVAAILEFFSCKPLGADAEILAIMGQVGTQLGRVIERDRAHKMLIHDALHDAMTGLPNRTFFNERLRNAFDRASRFPDEELAILVVDLDGFKSINDTLGHHAGDALLTSVASHLRDSLNRSEEAARRAGSPINAMLARIGGDEFTILLNGLLVTREAARVAEALHQELRKATLIDDKSIHVGASIGIAHYSSDYSEVDQLMRDADLAMYHAKTAGRGRTVIFNDTLGAQIRKAHALQQELRDAIQRREFVLYYQPIVTLDNTRAIKGFEALVRWNHPTHGLLAPTEFIPIAEETGLILFIGDWVLKEACSTIAKWHRRNPHNMPFMSVNISPKQFLQANFAHRVRAILFETDANPSSVRLEVTEGVAIFDAARTSRIIGEIRSWGVKTSLDDFGTGFSSLSYLQTLPFDAIKIDRSFITAMNGSSQGLGIVRTILDLARIMSMTVVAEGVETCEQEQQLAALGCDFAQGYHFGLPVDEATAFAMIDAMPVQQ